MPKTPTIPEILTEFEAEADRTTKWVSVDRRLLLRVCGELRARLEKEAPGGVEITIHPDPPHIAEEIRDLRRYGPRRHT